MSIIRYYLPDIDTLIHDHGIISKINANNDGFDYLPTYASPDEKWTGLTSSHLQVLTL